MNEYEIVNHIRNYVQNLTDLDDIHGIGHTDRVYNMCMHIGRKLNANLFILKMAALLHDIGRFVKNNKIKDKNHAEISAKLALKYIIKNNIPIQTNDIEKLTLCIKSHSFSNVLIPKTLEAKILSDADKLDALGAIGLYRTIGYTLKNDGNIHNVIKHLEDKIFKLNDMLFLDISKTIAKKRFEIIKLFYDEVKSEF